MLQSVNHPTLFTERQRLSLGNSMTDPNLDSHFSCTSSPSNSCFTDNFLAALCICFAATSHCYCPFAVYLSRTKLHAQHLPLSSCLPMYYCQMASAVTVRAPLVSAEQHPVSAPCNLCFTLLTVAEGNLCHHHPRPGRQSQAGLGAEVLLSNNQQQQIPSCPKLMKPKYWLGSRSCSFLLAEGLMLHCTRL